MPTILGLTVVGWHSMLDDWWNKLMAGLLLSSIVFGSLFVGFLLFQKVRRQWKSQKVPQVPSKEILRYFDSLQSVGLQNCPSDRPKKVSRSYGVYLGGFSSPPTPAQKQLLSKWDILVVNPLQEGIATTLLASCTSSQVLGRFDFSSLPLLGSESSNDRAIRALDFVFQTISTSFSCSQTNRVPFTGLSLANWQTRLSPAALNKLLDYINNLGLMVYLEVSPPTFLTEDECQSINLHLLGGLICRNGTILPDGDRRNYYQMEDMRRAQRAWATHGSHQGSSFIMWETVGKIEHAVIKRSYNWCRFNNALSWIGSEEALFDAELAAIETVPSEPLGALMWLKEESIMKIHDAWRLNDKLHSDSGDKDDLYEVLHSFVPDLHSKLSFTHQAESENSSVHSSWKSYTSTRRDSDETLSQSLQWNPKDVYAQKDPLSFSVKGEDYVGLGCFQLGLSCTSKDFDDLVDQQRQLRELGLLLPLPSEQLLQFKKHVQALFEALSNQDHASNIGRGIQELLGMLSDRDEEEAENLRIYTGLHSGFCISTDSQFWGIYDPNNEETLDIFISSKTKDIFGVILHTFLSSRGCSRDECFMAELALAQKTKRISERWNLPNRLLLDIEGLSPSETLLLMRRLSLASSDEFSAVTSKVQAVCEYQLLDVPSIAQLRALNSTAYLRNGISIDDLVLARIAWYCEQGYQCPDPSAAIALFREIDVRLEKILMNRESDVLARLQDVLNSSVCKHPINARADFLALAVFCAIRKLAMNEVNLEILDRNPLPNTHPDQAACYAEMFATGSQCEQYFDMTPNVLGKILDDRIRAYYNIHQPPMRDDNSPELPTAYASNLVDLDRNAGPQKLPLYYQITFLGIFALPALVDILLLTTIGRGLYLTAFMTNEEKSLATTALMLALFVTGAIGTWVSSGGSYYLHSMAFPTMNMFVLTRFIAGVAICSGSGALAFLVILIINGIYGAVIFLSYFLILSTYFSLLATLAIYQLPGFMFQSGRTVIISCIPILFISPLLTLWVDHDIVVYLLILTTFLCALLLGARKVISQWTTWYRDLTCLKDVDVLEWYVKNQAKFSKSMSQQEITDLETSTIPRQALLAAIIAEKDRHFWTRASEDELVRKLADQHLATNFLMSWYCKYTRSKMPVAFSPTWNLQCAAGLDTLSEMQKGLKLHNAFVHWRHAGNEVWCGVLYFVIALMDKWVALISNVSIVGLSAADDETYRLAVGFGLAAYLISAVFLDAVAYPLWATANKRTPRPVSSLQNLQQVAIDDARARRRLYWGTLLKYLFMHFYGLAVSTALMWTFEESRDAAVMFLAYVAAYTGLLWYQYNRIFAGTLALKDLLLAAALGITIGPLLHRFAPGFAYNSVISLAIATWTAALLSVWTSDVGWPSFKDSESITTHTIPTYHCSTDLGSKNDLSQSRLADLYKSMTLLPEQFCYRLHPSEIPGLEVLQIVTNAVAQPISKTLDEAFPLKNDYLLRIIDLWNRGQIVIDLVPSCAVTESTQDLTAISRTIDGKLHIFALNGLDANSDGQKMNISVSCRILAEVLIHISVQSIFSFTHDFGVLAKMILGPDKNKGELSLLESVKDDVEVFSSIQAQIVQNSETTLLHYLAIGLDCDIEWDQLPQDIRSTLLQRCCGKSCILPDEQFEWIRNRFSLRNPQEVDQHIARCNLGAELTSDMTSYAKGFDVEHAYKYGIDHIDEKVNLTMDTPLLRPVAPASEVIGTNIFRRFTNHCHYIIKVSLKLVVVALVADSEFQRELDYLVADQPGYIRWPLTFALTCLWRYCKTLQQVILPWFLLHKRRDITQVYSATQGTKTTVKKDRILVEGANSQVTLFSKRQPDSTITLHEYSGDYVQQPMAAGQLLAINTYTENLTLKERKEYVKGSLANSFIYEYAFDECKPRFPLQRQCDQGDLAGQILSYNDRGFITSGSYMKDGNLVNFIWSYRQDARFDDELLRGEYHMAHLTIRVSWCVPPPRNPEKLDLWLPNSDVMEATFIEGSDVYRSQWNYDHKSHPVIWTDLNGLPIETPPMIQHDWFNVLKKPTQTSFIGDNRILELKSIEPGFLSRMLRLNIHRQRISTSTARSYLWKAWKTSKDFDAVTARWLDESILRSEEVLKPYWIARDMGRLRTAAAYLEDQADNIMTRCDMDSDISSWTLLAFKFSDLLTFGSGGDATINTRNQKAQIRDNDDTLHVLAMDTGTWPNEGGGVSACRRDMVNNLSTIRWHVVAENANDFGLPKFQVEKNVHSLTVLPLWGLDFLTPTHGIFENYLDSAVQHRSHFTTQEDIEENFFPILTSLVRCARAVELTQQHLDEATQALIDLNAYFQSSRHWSDVWLSKAVKDKWRILWLSEEWENSRPISEWLQAEYPTLDHLDQALDMWHRYLFIFSVPVPEKIPDVFQASHHFAGASYGVLCKKLRNCTLHVWDHCISWREVTVFLSSAMSFDPPFVCSSLIALSRVTSLLVLTNADVILPCADFFNPGWEIELGTLESTIGHRRKFARRIDPVVNGIANMERFQPIAEIKSKKPTVTMLSHIRFVKDIKNAVLAADIIVNDWGFEDYTLEIYGDMIRAPAYSVECQELIAAKGLDKNVLLKGLGSPSKVLEDAWIFLNCSVSEGLPLAMGEAALTGVPVVCTDVGASFRVVTDTETGEKFSAVVAPNDAFSLARAQINVLALLDEWAAFAEDDPSQPVPKLSLRPTPEETKFVLQRMYDKTEQRRKLGMRGRENVLKHFSSDRYLREHEQMLWVGKYRSKSYKSRISVSESWTSSLLMPKKKNGGPMSKNSSLVMFG